MPIIQVGDELVPVQTRFVEASGDVDPDAALWQSLGGGGRRDLPNVTHERALEIAYALYRQNPLGSRITRLNRDFIVGDGIGWSTRNPQVEDIVGEFWEDEDNDLDERLNDFALELGLNGELCLEAFVGKVSGIVKLGYVDPTQIKRVSHVDGNPLILDQIFVKKKGAGIKGEPKKIIRRRYSDNDGDAAKLDGDVFFFKLNSLSNSTRGWPDLMHIGDWLEAYDQMLWDVLERARHMRSFVWDVLLKGADEATIQAWLRKHGTPPKAGTVRAHNESEVWTPIAPQMGSTEAATDGEVILEHLMGGAGFPKHWFASGEDVNLATAKEMGIPTERMLSARQRFFTRKVHRIVRFVLEKAEEEGTLKTDVDGLMPVYDEDGNPTDQLLPPHKLVEIQAPEISAKDMAAAGKLLVDVTNALATAEELKWFGKDVSRQAIAACFALMGVDFDPQMEPDEDEENPAQPDLPNVPSRKRVEDAIDAAVA